MSMLYENVLKRLREERIRLQLSQEQVSSRVRMSQSHYSKAELGTARFTYHEIQHLCESDMNVYYVFTGQRPEDTYARPFEGCASDKLRHCISVLCEVILCTCGKQRQECRERDKRRVEHTRIWCIPCETGNSALYILRHVLGRTQQDFADKLEIDIKKLRNLENGKILPDSELLWRIYREFDISPAIYMGEQKGLAREIASLLMLLKKKEREDAVRYLRDCCGILL
ncbi:MAG: helix-turn-helix domain-containing protein [Roseburia sp.]